MEKKLKGVNRQKFGSTTDRPFYQPDEIDEVGPGKYSKDELQEAITTRFGQLKKESFNFKSNTARNCFGEIKGTALSIQKT